MTGRELIVYILQNNLENEPMFADGKPIAHITIWEAAVKANVGTATVYAWIMNNWIDYIIVGGVHYIPADFKVPTDGQKE